MKRQLSRRAFIKRSANMGAATLVGGNLLSTISCHDGDQPDQPESADPSIIAVVNGNDRYTQTVKAIEILGGMERFVSKGAKVCILPNSQRNNPGVFTNPDIVRAVIDLCAQAGSTRVDCLSWLPRDSWESTGLAQAVEGAGATLKLVDRKDESLFRTVALPNGKILKEARIMEIFFEYDVFINVPITKDHMGNKFTGTMKNLMGLNSPLSNKSFHTGKGNFEIDNIEHLDQCIADLNTALKPTLCVVDATEFIITNGPFGPGKLHYPKKVVAGQDRVAIDAYCASLWDLNPGEIIMIKSGHEHGLGEIDLSRRDLRELEI